jgi:hypothetical protein
VRKLYFIFTKSKFFEAFLKLIKFLYNKENIYLIIFMQILITGTSSGIGKFLAENLAKTQQITGISRQKNLIPNISFFC